MAVLVEELGVPAVHHCLAGEHRPDPPRRVLEIDEPLGGRHLAIEAPGGALPERSGFERERHEGSLGSKTWRRWVNSACGQGTESRHARARPSRHTRSTWS